MTTPPADTSPAGLARQHAARMADTPPAPDESDYAYIRAYLFTYGWPAAEAIYGDALVRAAMIPADLPPPAPDRRERSC